MLVPGPGRPWPACLGRRKGAMQWSGTALPLPQRPCVHAAWLMSGICFVVLYTGLCRVTWWARHQLGNIDKSAVTNSAILTKGKSVTAKVVKTTPLAKILPCLHSHRAAAWLHSVRAGCSCCKSALLLTAASSFASHVACALSHTSGRALPTITEGAVRRAHVAYTSPEMQHTMKKREEKRNTLFKNKEQHGFAAAYDVLHTTPKNAKTHQGFDL